MQRQTTSQLKKMYDELLNRYKLELDHNKTLQDERYEIIERINRIRQKTSYIEQNIAHSAHQNSSSYDSNNVAA